MTSDRGEEWCSQCGELVPAVSSKYNTRALSLHCVRSEYNASALSTIYVRSEYNTNALLS